MNWQTNAKCMAAVLVTAFSASANSPKYPIDSTMEGPQSVYTSAMVELIKSWPPKDIDYSAKDESPVRIHRLETPGHRFYVGAEQVMFIKAPLARSEQVVDDIDHFKELLPGFKDIHVTSRDSNKYFVFWEHIIPVFFLPNVKYETLYITDKTSPTRKIYRYKLRRATSDINFADGTIVLEKASETQTRFTEYDFWDANYGIVKTFAPGRIWKDSIAGVFLADLAIKLRAEHSDWKPSQVIEESNKEIETFPLDDVLEKKKPFYLISEQAFATQSH